MNALRLFCLGVTTLVLAVSSSIRAADGDDEWKKVNDIIEGIRNPKENPQTSETARMMLKHSKPRPFSPAITALDSVDVAIHTGGCGSCQGLGVTMRAGKSRNSLCSS